MTKRLSPQINISLRFLQLLKIGSTLCIRWMVWCALSAHSEYYFIDVEGLTLLSIVCRDYMTEGGKMDAAYIACHGNVISFVIGFCAEEVVQVIMDGAYKPTWPFVMIVFRTVSVKWLLYTKISLTERVKWWCTNPTHVLRQRESGSNELERMTALGIICCL